MSNFDVNLQGRKLVETELLNRGALSVTTCGSHQKYLSVKTKKNNEIKLKIKVKRKGDWQTTIDEAINPDKPMDVTTKREFWIFVEIGDEPGFWIVPDKWIRNNIYTEHHKYLEKNNGHRPKNDDSNHHSIKENRLIEWQDKWEILGIG